MDRIYGIRQGHRSGVVYMKNVVAFVLLGFLMVAGCKHVPLKPIGPAPSRGQAIALYNANVKAIGNFKASISKWEIQITDDKGKTHHYHDISGKVYYKQSTDASSPACFYLQASVPLFEPEALVLGSNDKEYWMYSRRANRGWWGKYINFGKPCAGKMPINPQEFLALAGLRPLPTRPYYPVYRIGDKDYTLEYIVPDKKGFSVTREIIIDRRTGFPRQINVYDSDGRIIMQSKLSNPQKLGRALLPGEIVLSSPREKSYILLKLKKFRRAKKINMRLFKRPQHISGISDYEQIDRGCDNGKG